MTAWSKFFNENLRHRSCANDLLHPHSCWLNFFINSYRFVGSNIKFFLPIALVSVLLKFRKLNKDELKKLAHNYIDTVITGYSIGFSICTLMCVLRHLLGEFPESGVVVTPSILGSFFTYYGSRQVQHLFMTSTFQATVESILLQRRLFVATILMKSRNLQTLVFMICNGLILHAKRNHIYKGFWLLTPDGTRPSDDNTTKTCLHANCKTHFWQGIRSYLAIGLTLDAIAMLKSKVTTTLPKSFASLVMAKLRNFRCRTSTFLVASLAIYRFTLCYLNRHATSMNPDHRHLIACCLAGACYRLYPKLNLLAYGIVLSIYVLHTHFLGWTMPAEWRALEYLKIVPYSRIIFPFSLGFLIDLYIRDRQNVAQLGANFINGLTNNYAKRISYNIDLMK